MKCKFIGINTTSTDTLEDSVNKWLEKQSPNIEICATTAFTGTYKGTSVSQVMCIFYKEDDSQ